MAIWKLRYGYPLEGQGREEDRESQSPQGLEAARPLRPQVQQNPENITIKTQDRIPRLIFDRAVVCLEAISKFEKWVEVKGLKREPQNIEQGISNIEGFGKTRT